MFVGMAKQYPAFSHTSFAIEMVCKNRRTYNGKIHSELAISYPYNEPFLLGVLASNGWIPSYRTLHTEFKIPVSFQLTTSFDAFTKLEELNKHLTHPEGFVVCNHSGQTDKVLVTCKFKNPLYYDAHQISKYEKLFNTNYH